MVRKMTDLVDFQSKKYKKIQLQTEDIKILKCLYFINLKQQLWHMQTFEHPSNTSLGVNSLVRTCKAG